MPEAFQFKPGDLVAWIQRKKDGSVVRYELTAPATTRKESYYQPTQVSSVAKWCDHTPKLDRSVFDDPKGQFKLFAGDAPGVRKAKSDFDLVIDGGDVLVVPKKSDILEGDETLVKLLEKHSTKATLTKPRVLQIDWFDRMAPELHPAFWKDLAAHLKGNVICCCQGGHGRTGTALVSLMMALTDYDALDAITHLRAIHCPRAIESVVQHQYLNIVAAYFKRTPNALEAETVKDFRNRFLTEVNSKFAKPYQARLLAETTTKES